MMPEQPAEPLKLPLIALVLSGGVLASLALTAINSVLPAIDSALAHSARDGLLVKQLLGGVGLAMVFGAALGGILVDRFGLRRLLLAAAILYGLSGTAGLYLSSLPMLLASRLLIGLAAGSLQVASLTAINTRIPQAARARWMGIHVSLAMFTALIAHPISGLLGNHGWRWPFAIYALGFVMIPVALGQTATPHIAKPRPAAQLDPAHAGPSAGFPWHYLPFAILIGSVVFIPTVYVPYMLRARGVATPLLISFVLTADSVAGMGMALLYGRARKTLSVHSAFIVSFAVATLGMLTAIVSSTIAGFVAGIMIYGVGVGWLIANLVTSLSEKVSAARQGSATGLVKAAHFSSAPLCILIIEPFARRGGPDVALWATAAIALFLLIVILLRTVHRLR